MTPAPASHPSSASAAGGFRVPKWRAWIMASRLPTLPAAVVPVIVGGALALRHATFNRWAFVAALGSALLIQIGTNFANDLFDYHKGADTEERTGPVRVCQAGLLSPGEVMKGTWLTFGLAFAIGMYLVYLGGWPILAVGLAAILCGLGYTGGPWPLAYHGLGDIFAFLFFGVVAVVGTYFVLAKAISPDVWWVSLPVAALVTAILVVNNLRDIETDRLAGKRTLAVRLGKRGTQLEYIALLALAYGVPAAMSFVDREPWLWLPWLTLPLALRQVRTVFTATGRELNAALKGTGKLHLFYGVLFSLSLLV